MATCQEGDSKLPSASSKRIPCDDEDNKDSLVLWNQRHTATKSRSFADFFPPWLRSLQLPLSYERLKKIRLHDAEWRELQMTEKQVINGHIRVIDLL